MKLLVLLALLAVSFAADCNNPLLADATVKSNVGATNIATSVQTAGASLPICKWLEGKSVCASSYDTLSSSIQTSKDNLKAATSARNEARWGGIDTNVDIESCAETAVYVESFVAFSILSGGLNSSASISYNGLGATIKAQWDAVVNTDQYKAEIALAQQEADQIDTYTSDYISGKANCSAQLFAWQIYVNCLATDADYSSKLSGTGSNVDIFVKSGTCDHYKSECLGYFDAAGKLAGIAGFGAICSSSLFDDITSDLQADWSDSINTELNGYWTQLKNDPELLGAAGSFGGGDGFSGESTYDANAFVGLSCSESNSNGFDCDFICNDVLRNDGKGFNTNAYLNLDGSINNRRRLSNGPSERSDGPDPVALTSNEDTTADEDDDPFSGSNASKLFLSLSLLLGLIFVL
jgi:hypothetical protein